MLFYDGLPAKLIKLDPVKPQSGGELLYRGICPRVTHEKPYSPPKQLRQLGDVDGDAPASSRVNRPAAVRLPASSS
jgi:hypothetical protein